MLRKLTDGQLHVMPFQRVGPPFLYSGGGGAIEKVGDQTFEEFTTAYPKVVEYIGTQAVEKHKGTLPKVPDKYDIKVPEKSILPATTIERTAAFARKLGLTDTKLAQELLDFANTEAQSVIDQTVGEHTEQVKKWENEILAAADLGGGKPEKLQAITARVKRLVEKFFPEGARKLLDSHGLGSNPDFIRGLSKIADAAKEDMLETGAGGGGRRGTAAERLYPTMK